MLSLVSHFVVIAKWKEQFNKYLHNSTDLFFFLGGEGAIFQYKFYKNFLKSNRVILIKLMLLKSHLNKFWVDILKNVTPNSVFFFLFFLNTAGCEKPPRIQIWNSTSTRQKLYSLGGNNEENNSQQMQVRFDDKLVKRYHFVAKRGNRLILTPNFPPAKPPESAPLIEMALGVELRTFIFPNRIINSKREKNPIF